MIANIWKNVNTLAVDLNFKYDIIKKGRNK